MLRAASISAATDGPGPHLRSVAHSHRPVDPAMRFSDARPRPGGLRGERLTEALADAVPPPPCAGQSAVIRGGRGAAGIAFRELPVDVAALMIAGGRGRAGEEGAGFEPDWPRPQRISVTVIHITGFSRPMGGLPCPICRSVSRSWQRTARRCLCGGRSLRGGKTRGNGPRARCGPGAVAPGLGIANRIRPLIPVVPVSPQPSPRSARPCRPCLRGASPRSPHHRA